MRAAVIIACLIILAGLGGGVAWGWIESQGALPAVAAVGPAKAQAKPADPDAAFKAEQAKAFREDIRDTAIGTASPMGYERKMAVPYDVASRMLIGKAMNMDSRLERSWLGSSSLRVSISSLTNQRTTSTILENGKAIMTTTVTVESADGGQASILRMKVDHDPVAMARLLNASHPRKGNQDVGPKISAFAIKTAMTLMATQITRQMDKGYAEVVKSPDKKDDLRLAAYNNGPGLVPAILYGVGEGVFPETKGRRAPAPGW